MTAAAPVIVVGAGIGGLACALRLAAAGHPVTVLERQAAPGGKIRSLDSPAGPVDAGPTVLTLRGVFDALFAAAGARLEDHVRLTRQTVLARHWWPDGSTLDLHADPEASAAAVRAFAGRQGERDFRAFGARAAQLFRAFEGPVLETAAPSLPVLTRKVMAQPRLVPLIAPNATLAQLLARQFRDPRLAQLFGRYATYVGGSPYRAPAILALIWQAEAAGVWTVAGGMQALARAIADLAATKGAAFHYEAEVASIEAPGGTVNGVVLADGTRLPARAVVFNGDPRALAGGLLGGDVAHVAAGTPTAERSLSAHVWAFAARASGARLAHHNVFFCRDPREEFEALQAGRVPGDATLYLCAQDRGGEAAPPEVERFEMIRNAPPLAADGIDDERGEVPCQAPVCETLARFGLRLEPPPGAATLTGPAGFARLFPGSRGALYGQSPHGMMTTFQRPTARTPVAGLYLAGGGVHPGPGVPMATLSGRHAAAAIAADLASPSPSRRTAMRGGMSTG